MVMDKAYLENIDLKNSLLLLNKSKLYYGASTGIGYWKVPLRNIEIRQKLCYTNFR